MTLNDCLLHRRIHLLVRHGHNHRHLSSVRAGLGVPQGMLGTRFPSCPDRLACMGLVSNVIVPSRVIRHGILPQSCLAQPGSSLFYFIFAHDVW